jgi:hypothetical protein
MTGGWLWLLIDVGFVAVLGAAIAYGMVHVRRRSARQKKQTDQATRDLYDRQH